MRDLDILAKLWNGVCMGKQFIMKRHRVTMRLQKWDYRNTGWYFVTIRTNREPFFGRIENHEMKLSVMGTIVRDCWMQIPKHFTNVKLDEFNVMPDHVHELSLLCRTSGRCRTGLRRTGRCNATSLRGMVICRTYRQNRGRCRQSSDRSNPRVHI